MVMNYIRQQEFLTWRLEGSYSHLSHSKRALLKQKIVAEFREKGIKAMVYYANHSYFTVKFMTPGDEATFIMHFSCREET
jgi:DNA-binding transcriptional regulator GbsR (MarR family)